jgi:hypothetical protein
MNQRLALNGVPPVVDVQWISHGYGSWRGAIRHRPMILATNCLRARSGRTTPKTDMPDVDTIDLIVVEGSGR